MLQSSQAAGPTRDIGLREGSANASYMLHPMGMASLSLGWDNAAILAGRRPDSGHWTQGGLCKRQLHAAPNGNGIIEPRLGQCCNPRRPQARLGTLDSGRALQTPATCCTQWEWHH